MEKPYLGEDGGAPALDQMPAVHFLVGPVEGVDELELVFALLEPLL